MTVSPHHLMANFLSHTTQLQYLAAEEDEMTAGDAAEEDEMTAGDAAEEDEMTAGDAAEEDEMTAGVLHEEDEMTVGDAAEEDEMTAEEAAEEDEMTALDQSADAAAPRYYRYHIRLDYPSFDFVNQLPGTTIIISGLTILHLTM